jgi:folate-binding protein YgfZ
MNSATRGAGAVEIGYGAARSGAALLGRADRARLVVSGKDRASFLQGLLTNDVLALEAGQGCYSAYLTPQGRMITDLWAYELGDVILLSLPRAVKDTVLARLDQMIFSEDVQLGDVSDSFMSVAVVGPRAVDAVAAVLSGAGSDILRALRPHGNLRAGFEGEPAIVLKVIDTGEPGFELLVDARHGDDLKNALLAAGVVELDESVAEILRIEAGVPTFRRDMDEETIPLEAGIEPQAVSLTKGCYVGQEVIIRVLHRGHGRVARKLVGLAVAGETVPPPGAIVSAEGREVGHVTSSTFSPVLKRPIALAYLHRDFLAPGTSVRVGDSGATVTELPFVPSKQA